ncbi:MAG: Dam family site-specific DNA-(adenine-N6)-methyltransferase [Bacteroidia bacterium]|nr:Dam family site-specific DNA-(adenine-N6)-methyltransferase [Bacteroidia bacterium]
MEPSLSPPLKWAGGKRWLVPHLRPFWRAYARRRWVEPFCGGLSLALALRPEEALLSDINPHLINFYIRIQQGLSIEINLINSREVYYAHRDRFNTLIRQGAAFTEEGAQLFYYLNRTGYNGLCRFNRRGEFNVPFGRYKHIAYQRDFYAYRTLMEGWTFQRRDFSEVVLLPTDFIYADPPYDVPFRQYSAEGFSWRDQVRLAEWLAAHPGPVIASNQATDRVVHLYTSLGFRIVRLRGPRRISCTGDRTPAQEILAFRNIEL